MNEHRKSEEQDGWLLQLQTTVNDENCNLCAREKMLPLYRNIQRVIIKNADLAYLRHAKIRGDACPGVALISFAYAPATCCDASGIAGLKKCDGNDLFESLKALEFFPLSFPTAITLAKARQGNSDTKPSGMNCLLVCPGLASPLLRSSPPLTLDSTLPVSAYSLHKNKLFESFCTAAA